jgi:hypothetical protein
MKAWSLRASSGRKTSAATRLQKFVIAAGME